MRAERIVRVLVTGLLVLGGGVAVIRSSKNDGASRVATAERRPRAE